MRWIEIDDDKIVVGGTSIRDRSSRRKQLRRDDDATKQRAEIELLRLQRAEISQRVWIALLTFALAIITALTTVMPLLVQQYAQQTVPPVATGPRN